MQLDKINIEFFRKYLGNDFEFRRGQLEIIKEIWKLYNEDSSGTVICELPTGSGKSVLAFCIALLFNYNDNDGYIIPSDISLQNQYENDLFRYKLLWGCIKGTDNYTCDVNELPFSLGDCQVRKLSYKQAKMLPCYNSCAYFCNREKAIKSKTSILNYSYWLIQQNIVLNRVPDAPFEKRSFCIFDEAHKIEDIVQNHFAPVIKSEDYFKIKKLDTFLAERPMLGKRVKPEIFKSLFDSVFFKETEIIENLIKLRTYLCDIDLWSTEWKENTVNLYQKEPIPKDILAIFSITDWCSDLCNKLNDYLNIIEVYPDSLIRAKDFEAKSIKFFTTEEATLINKRLLEKSEFKIFMSATIGNPKDYAKKMGIQKFKYIQMGSDFDFSKSPIIIFNKFRMSYKEKDISYPKLLNLMDAILEKHKNEKGIIHSGSYQLATNILNDSKYYNRLLKYDNAKEKELLLEHHKNTNNTIIIGPTLIEGLNLEDDLSRFQIFFKMPYPSLTDELVKGRMKANNEWYNWKTSISFLQGLGRSNRNKEDYCTTYILDACFLDLIKNNTFPKWISDRFQYM